METGTSLGASQGEKKSTLVDTPQGEPSSSSVSWKAEYEAQVETWRAQSSEARKKAENERKRWEEVRALEREEAARRNAEHEAGWETVSNSRKTDSTVASGLHIHSPADSRNLVTGESDRQFTLSATSSAPPTAVPRTHSHPDAESQKWEDIHSSVTSSFPSMTYPERSETPSPSQNRPAPSQPAPPPTTTLAIFDSTLSTRTRVKALFSSVAINMLLPFVNGVMLGFGEIFAKNLIMGWLGWKIPASGSVATTTGVGITSPWGQRQKPKQS